MRNKTISLIMSLFVIVNFPTVTAVADHSNDEYKQLEQNEVIFPDTSLAIGDTVTIDYSASIQWNSGNPYINGILVETDERRQIYNFEITEQYLNDYEYLKIEGRGDGSVDKRLYHVYLNGEELWNGSMEIGSIYSSDYPVGNVSNIIINEKINSANIKYELPNEDGFQHTTIYLDNEKYIEDEGKEEAFIENLDPNTLYTIGFKSVYDNGSESNISEHTFTTLPEPTNDIEVINLNATTENQNINLSYDVPTDDAYENTNVYLNDEFIGEDTSGEYTISDVEPAADYEVKVTTVDSEELESDGVIQEVRTKALDPIVDQASIYKNPESIYHDVHWETDYADTVRVLLDGQTYALVEASQGAYSIPQEEIGEDSEVSVQALNTVDELESEPMVAGVTTFDPSTELPEDMTTMSLLQTIMGVLRFLGPIILLALSVAFTPTLISFFRKVIKNKRNERHSNR